MVINFLTVIHNLIIIIVPYRQLYIILNNASVSRVEIHCT